MLQDHPRTSWGQQALKVREREREKVEFWIQARVQGMISAPSRLQWFRGMCDLREPTALLSQICSHMIGATLEKML